MASASAAGAVVVVVVVVVMVVVIFVAVGCVGCDFGDRSELYYDGGCRICVCGSDTAFVFV